MAVGRMDNIGLNHQVLIDEVGGIRVVGPDSPDLCGGQIDPPGTLLSKEVIYGLLVREVKLRMSSRNDVSITAQPDPAQHGGTYHAAVTRNVGS